MKKVLIFAAHPDDEVLGCGGLIAKYSKMGVDFRIVFIGEGSTCRYDNVFDPDASKEILIRNKSAEKALKYLNVNNYEFNNLPCGKFDQIPIIEINKIIEKNIILFEPDTVFTHSQFDANNDHKIVFNSTIMATRPVGNSIVSSLFSYEVLSTTEWSYGSPFCPNFFEELTEDHIMAKWNALSMYFSEIKEYPFPRSLEGVKTLSRMRGMQSGFRFAEAYQLIRKFRI